jgi:hypothetical protein
MASETVSLDQPEIQTDASADPEYQKLLTKLSELSSEDRHKFITNLQNMQKAAQVVPDKASTRAALLEKLHNKTSMLNLKRKPKKILKNMATNLAKQASDNVGPEVPD